jgi:hypothetical protein
MERTMSQVKDYIADRIRKLQDSLVPLRQEAAAAQAKIELIERELVDLQTAAKAIGIANGLQTKRIGATRRKPPETTIKQAVLQVLADYPEGLIALDLLAKINERFDWQLVRPSLSPQLTRLKRESKIVNLGSIWQLAKDPDLFLHTYTKTK